MKKLDNWIIKIIDKKHFYEVIKVLDGLGYNTHYCVWFETFVYRNINLFCNKNIVFVTNVDLNGLKTYTLEEFIKAHNSFKNMKFRISSKEEDEKLQKYLFSLGYKWRGDDGFKYFCAIGEYNKFLYTHDTGILGWSDYDSYFDNHPYQEYTLEELITYELREVVKVNCKNCGKEIDTNMKNHFKFNNGSYLCWDCFKEVEHACFPF